MSPITLAEDHQEPASFFAAAVRSGKVEDFLSPEFNLDAMAIMEAAQRSAELGRPVSLPLQ